MRQLVKVNAKESANWNPSKHPPQAAKRRDTDLIPLRRLLRTRLLAQEVENLPRSNVSCRQRVIDAQTHAFVEPLPCLVLASRFKQSSHSGFIFPIGP